MPPETRHRLLEVNWPGRPAIVLIIWAREELEDVRAGRSRSRDPRAADPEPTICCTPESALKYAAYVGKDKY